MAIETKQKKRDLQEQLYNYLAINLITERYEYKIPGKLPVD
jgi:hypothetical protein